MKSLLLSIMSVVAVTGTFSTGAWAFDRGGDFGGRGQSFGRGAIQRSENVGSRDSGRSSSDSVFSPERGRGRISPPGRDRGENISSGRGAESRRENGGNPGFMRNGTIAANRDRSGIESGRDHSAIGNSRASRDDGRESRRDRGGSDFPKYSPGIKRLPERNDSLGNRVTEDHLHRVEFAHGRAEDRMRRDTRVTDVVRVGRARFTNFYRPEFEHRRVVFDNYISHYNRIVIERPVVLNVWRNHFFFGGLNWGFHPIVEIDTYFYNPMVYWFYVGTFDEYYYRNWYHAQYDAYPELHRPFEYHGLYYPTENLKQLLFGVSAMSVEKQARFRTSISIFTQRLAQEMADGLDQHVRLGNGDIVVTHYEIAGPDDAVVLEGFVNYNGNAYNFKGLVDLEAPRQTDVFVPATWDKNPTPDQLSRLDALNAKVAAIKGEPVEAVSASPKDTEASPDPVAIPPSNAEVSADPQKKDVK